MTNSDAVPAQDAPEKTAFDGLRALLLRDYGAGEAAYFLGFLVGVEKQIDNLRSHLEHIRDYVTEAAKTPITREAILAQSITFEGLRMLALGQHDEMQGLCRLVLSETGPTGG